MSVPDDTGKTIVIRDRRKPNQYTTDNLIAREWLPILRVGDAFFFYSVYLSMANRETESSWGSLRTLAAYLQCGVDLIVRGNKLLEICELIHIEPGNQHTSNEYYILDPPALTDDLKARMRRRLQYLQERETGKNWLAWTRQVSKALDRHRSLPSIWTERRARRGGRPLKTVRPQNPDRESQTGFSDEGDREPQAGHMWDTSTLHVAHARGERDSHAEQETLTEYYEQVETKDPDSLSLLVQKRCRHLQIAPQAVDVLVETYGLVQVACQLDSLPFRNARDPAAMLVSAIHGSWTVPSQYNAEEATQVWDEWMGGPTTHDDDPQDGEMVTDVALPSPASAASSDAEAHVDAARAWELVLEELRLQMTRAAFDTWLRGSQGLALHDDTMVVRVCSEYALDWLHARWVGPIERTVAGILGRPVAVRFEV